MFLIENHINLQFILCCSSFVSTVHSGRGGKEIGVLCLKYVSEDSDPDENDIPVAGRPQASVAFI